MLLPSALATIKIDEIGMHLEQKRTAQGLLEP